MNYKELHEMGIMYPPADSHLYKHLFNGLPENKANYQRVINQTVNLVVEHLEERNTPFTGVSIEKVRERFEGINLNDFPDGIPLPHVLDELKSLYLNDAISFHQNKYVAHLNCPILIPTLAAEVIISAINTSMDTWDQSTGATFIELELIKWTLNQLGMPENGDGVFTSGGTQSNLMGLLLARDHYIKSRYGIDPKVDGIPPEASKFRVFCSSCSHFSLKKSAALLGLGHKAIIPVAVDAKHRMDVADLKKAIDREVSSGNIPIALVGTAGTTDFSAIDPLREVAQVAAYHQLWFHVDAAYGGGLLLSKLHKHKIEGIELADSITVDYHKTFFQPVSSSAFFVRNAQAFDYVKYHADYLNSKEQENDGMPNMVKKSIQTTRRFDALKLWMTLRTVGIDGLGKYIEDIITLASDTYQLMKIDNDFEVLNEPEISAIVFRFAPNEVDESELCQLNAFIRKTMFGEGQALIASTKVNGKTYLKFTLLNPLTSLHIMEEIIMEIKNHGYAYINKNLSVNQLIKR